MKRRLLTLVAFVLATATAINAQIFFSDDFESYSPGDLIAQVSSDWTTWGGGGTADDAPVTDEIAFSGMNSLKLLSTSPNGGPADVVLPFGGKHEIGTFTFDMQMLVVQGTGAYFNFQGETTVGQEWVAQFYFLANGELQVGNSNNVLQGTGTYPYNMWFNISAVVDLTNNNWVVYLDGDEVANFANPNNTVASLDLYPTFSGGTSQFYVDDIAFTYEPPILPDWDAGVNAVRMRQQGLTGQSQQVKGTIKNTGVNTINSFDITWSDGTNSFSQSYSGYNIPSLGSADFYHDDPYTILDGSQVLSVTVSDPNGMPDGNAANDTYDLNMTGYSPHPDKAVLIEEGTGTWCTWCPRGDVYMDSMTHTYPDHYVGIAVHNGDPMTIAEYDDGLNISAFPNIAIERTTKIGFGVPEDIEIPFLQRVVQAPPARLNQNVKYDHNTNELTVTISAEFLQNVSGNYRLSAILVEDGVTGTGSGYNQINAYANGNNGWMGGYELLPNPVPASIMVYNLVGRALLGGFNGSDDSLPDNISAGETHEYTYTYTVDPSVVDMENTKVVAIITNPNGKCENATQVFYDDFDEIVSSGEVFANHRAEVYPNPFTDQLFVRLGLENTTNVEMTVFNSLGAVVAQRDYGQLSGDQILSFNAEGQTNGIYYFHIKTDDYLITKKAQLLR